MRLHLKSDQYYDFYKIRKIIVTEEQIEIEGSFKKGGRYKKIKLNWIMIDDNSWRQLKSYMKKVMKRFDYEGKCPHCESENIWLYQHQTHRKEVNNPKQKIKKIQVKDGSFFCGACAKTFTKEQMKYSDVILYYN